jgi:hypothetical protein
MGAASFNAGLSANSDTGFRFKFPWKLPFET